MTERSSRSAPRLDAARRLLETSSLDALIVSRIQNVRYLSGFTGSSAALLISGTRALLVTDARYEQQASVEAAGWSVETAAGTPVAVAARRAAGRRVGFEADAVTYEQWESMRAAGQDGDRPGLIPCRGLIEGLRAIKTSDELELIQRAVDIAARALEATLPLARAGAVERDLALEIELRVREQGAEGLAFPPIVASGPRSSLPHGRATDRAIGPGEFIVFDIGALFRGYHSDMTRTVHAGAAGGEARRIYETVLEAQTRAIEAVRPGVPAQDVDRAAREVIEKAGHGQDFGHGTGHGVGLEVHEAPRVGAKSTDVLASGMVLTIEPGIYVRGAGGVRIEDMVLVTPSGHRVLTPTRKDLWLVE